MTSAVPRSLARRIVRRTRAGRGHRSAITILDSNSMAPLIRGHCHADVHWGVPDREVQAGMLVVAGWDDLLIVHRVIAATSIDGHLAVLQMADNLDPGNPFGATWIDGRDILGVVTRVRTSYGTTRYARGWWLCRAVDRIAAWLGMSVWKALERHQLTRLAALRILRTTTFALAAVAVRLLVALPIIGVPRAAGSGPGRTTVAEEDRYTRADDLESEREGDTVVVRLTADEWGIFEGSALDLWQLLAEPRSLPELVRELSGTYRADSATIARDTAEAL
ncbi:MAG: hypothetical protein JWM15_240, partial [Cryptosporangiaceae bacterium]|nr:hypothetical protein [Cryptosporangiaceae bacterium]